MPASGRPLPGSTVALEVASALLRRLGAGTDSRAYRAVRGLLRRRPGGQTTDASPPSPVGGASETAASAVGAGERPLAGEPDAATLPIVFIHRSNSAYLQYSLAQARASNPAAPIYLLGDASNDRYPAVEHRPIADYEAGALEFRRHYRHHSSNPYGYELLNFQRWFVLRDFLAATGLRRCLYLDSDVMLYADAAAERRRFAVYDFTLSHRICPCVMFLNRVEALDEFCEFLLRIYTGRDPYAYHRIVAQYVLRGANRLTGGACDMTAFEMYAFEHFGAIGEVSEVRDGAVFDPGIRDPYPGFAMRNGIKEAVWRDGVPYGRSLRTGDEVRFCSLHFQGSAKRLMGEYLSPAGHASAGRAEMVLS